MADIGNTSPRIAAVKDYFRRGDAGRPDMLELFADDFQFYFPKFGIGRGKDDFMAFATGLVGSLNAIAHDIDAFSFIESGDKVVVEGTTHGEDNKGAQWQGGRTPGGRFCSVFQFEGALIARMHIYLDPDYTSRDEEHFLWGKDRRW
ncbi:MAG: nuclear transport factor 2 family protein [Alphaproteobacteria bacterium]|nr:nuclear transport factor 2 family protein [Alphaproteobacteria bacterium]